MAMRRPLPGRACLHAREEVFELGKHVLDLVTLFVYGFTVYCRVFTFGSGRDAGGYAALNQGRAISVAIVALVA